MLPNLIVIGAQKCGTTSLHYYLDAHPQISMSRAKELDFFISERNWQRGIKWYGSQFPVASRVRGESSPNYTSYPRRAGVPGRMCAVIPDAKLIYIVRPPLDRILAHYVHNVAAGKEDKSIEEAVEPVSRNHYVARSCYFTQLEQYLPFYPQSRILVIAQEDLLQRRRETLQSIFRFLGVDHKFASWRWSKIRHKSSQKRRKTPLGKIVANAFGDRIVTKLPPVARYRCERLLYLPISRRIKPPQLSAELRRQLCDVLCDEVRGLEELTKRRFHDWLE